MYVAFPHFVTHSQKKKKFTRWFYIENLKKYANINVNKFIKDLIILLIFLNTKFFLYNNNFKTNILKLWENIFSRGYDLNKKNQIF